MSNPITSPSPVIIGIGEVLWDIFPDGKKIGGAPANFAYHVSQFGFTSCVVSAIGKDNLGEEMLYDFRNIGLNYIAPAVDYPTGTVTIKIDNDGIPSYNIDSPAAWDIIPMTDDLKQFAVSTQAVCFGSLAQRSDVSRKTIHNFIQLVKDSSKYNPLIIFDINLRQNFYTSSTIIESLSLCNILKINDEELATLTAILDLPSDDFLSACHMLMERYSISIIILTCGINGSYAISQNKTSFLETPQVVVADTVGAGDSFTAAFIAATLRGNDLKVAHELAVVTSAYVCTQSGAMPTLPSNILNH